MPQGLTIQKQKERGMFRRLLTAQRERELWNRHLDSEDDSVSQKAFALWLAYTYGKPLQPLEASGTISGTIYTIRVEYIGNTSTFATDSLATQAGPIMEIMGLAEEN